MIYNLWPELTLKEEHGLRRAEICLNVTEYTSILLNYINGSVLLLIW